MEVCTYDFVTPGISSYSVRRAYRRHHSIHVGQCCQSLLRLGDQGLNVLCLSQKRVNLPPPQKPVTCYLHPPPQNPSSGCMLCCPSDGGRLHQHDQLQFMCNADPTMRRTADVRGWPGLVADAGDWNGAGGHVNYSNNATRAKGTGWDAIQQQIAKLEKRHAYHIAQYGEVRSLGAVVMAVHAQRGVPA